MGRLTIAVAVVVGLGLLFTASIYTVYWPHFKRKRRSIPQLLADLEECRARAAEAVVNHPHNVNPAIEKSFQRYARRTLILEGIPPEDEQQIDCIRQATVYVTDRCEWGNITESNIRTIHAHIMIAEDPSIAGQFRTHDVYIQERDVRTIFPRHADVQRLINEFLTWINEQPHETFENRLFLAAEAKLRLVSIHPFADGNGRASRALLAGLLRKMPEVPFIAIPYTTRQDYFNALRLAQKEENNETFFKFIFTMIEESYENFIKELSDV